MEEFVNYIHPPLGLYRIKSSLDEFGVDTEIFDPNLVKTPHLDLSNLIERSDFDLVGFSSNHITIGDDLSLMHLAYNLDNDLLLVGGGIENSLNHREILKHAPPGFIIVRGEGELVLRDFCKNPDRKKTPGLIWMKNGTLCFSDPRPNLLREQFTHFTMSLDWENVPFESYWTFLENFNLNNDFDLTDEEIRTVRLILSNFCSRGCKFCSTTNFLRQASNKCPRTFRLSVDDVKNLIMRIHHSHPRVKTIFFHDDDLIAKKRWSKDFCDMIISSKESGEIPSHLGFMAQGSVLNASYLAPYLADSGFRLLGLGVESFSPKVLKEFNKRQTVDHVHNAINSLIKFGTMPYVNLILSSPDSKVEDLILTVNEALKCLEKGALIAISMYTLAFPGSDWVQELGDTDLITYRSHEIQGTSLKIKLADKILPNDLLLREVLSRSEDELNAILKEPLPNKKRIRSYMGCVTLYSIFKVLKQMELIDGEEQLDEARQKLFINESCPEYCNK